MLGKVLALLYTVGIEPGSLEWEPCVIPTPLRGFSKGIREPKRDGSIVICVWLKVHLSFKLADSVLVKR